MSIDLEKHRPMARLLLRLLGIYFIVNGATGVVGGGLTVFWTFREHLRVQVPFVPDTNVAWLVAAVLELLVGLYLTFKGRMAMDAVFHEMLERPAVPCPECGFDLRGSAKSTHCPECGVDLNRSADA